MPNRDFDQLISNGSFFWMALGISASVVVVVALIWFVIKTRRSPEDRMVEQCVKDNCIDYARNIILSDGLYGYYFIDYVILQPDKIIVVGMEHLDGYIFGSEQVEEWAQVLNKQSKNFPNPLLFIDMYIQTIQSFISGVDIVGRLIFTGDCSFPKGVPAGVMSLENLNGEFKKLKTVDSPADNLREKWNILLDVAQQQKQQFIKEGK